jgi:hypothetical protein
MAENRHLAWKACSFGQPWILPVVAVAVLGWSVYQALWLPIYPDEVAHRIVLERYFLSDGMRQSLIPFCAESFLKTPPLLLKPAAIFWSSLSWLGDSWLAYRLPPLVALTALVVAVQCILGTWRSPVAPCMLLMTIGPAFYGLVILRAEVFLLAAGAVLLLLGQRMLAGQSVLRTSALAAAGAVVYSLACYVHPKAIYLIIIPLGAGILAARSLRSRRSKIGLSTASLIVLPAIAWSAVQLHSSPPCAEAPGMTEFLTSQAVNPLDLLSNRPQFWRCLTRALAPAELQNIAAGMQFPGTPEIGYLPAFENGARVSALNLLIMIVFFAAFVAAWSLLFDAWRRARGLKSRDSTLLIAAFGIGLLMPYVLSLVKHWYEDSLCMATVAVLLTLSISQRAAVAVPDRVDNNHNACGGRRPINISSMVGAGVILAVAIASQWLIALRYTPAFRNGYQAVGIPIRTNRAKIEESIGDLMRQFQIQRGEPMIVDDLTYDSLRDCRIVLPITYLGFAGDDPDLLRRTLQRYSVRFGIVRVIRASPEMQRALNMRILAVVVDEDPAQAICVLGEAL